VGTAPQLVLQLALYLHGLFELTGPLQLANFMIGVAVVGRSVIMYDVLYKEGTTADRAVHISLVKKFCYSIQVPL
jgi:hypothetical protein